MGKLSDKFQSLDSFEKRKVHIKSCNMRTIQFIIYIESIVKKMRLMIGLL